MFGISFEHILIVGVILLLVGPKRLPELGNTMGKAIKNFKDSFTGVEEAAFKRVEQTKAEQEALAAAALKAQAAAPSSAEDVIPASSKPAPTDAPSAQA